MAACLGLHAVARVDQNNRQACGGGTGRHVTGVLLVPRGVGNDELALLRREETVGHIDGDALLALRLQAVYQQRKIHRIPCGAAGFRGLGDRRQLIFKDHLGVVKHPPDQGGFTIVDAAAGNKAQQVFVFVLVQVLLDVIGN